MLEKTNIVVTFSHQDREKVQTNCPPTAKFKLQGTFVKNKKHPDRNHQKLMGFQDRKSQEWVIKTAI